MNDDIEKTKLFQLIDQYASVAGALGWWLCKDGDKGQPPMDKVRCQFLYDAAKRLIKKELEKL